MGKALQGRSVDDLSFTSRDHLGRIRWWDITPPKTDYWHAHVEHGRAYARELLGLMGEFDFAINGQQIGFILKAVGESNPVNDGMLTGFFEEIGKAVAASKT